MSSKQAFFFFGSFLSLIILVVEHSIEIEAIELAIFYDAEDSASIQWFKTEFNPNHKMFKGYVKFEFFPCQNMQVDSKKKMSCPSENCYLDRIHACAYSHIKDNTVLSDFISCAIDKGVNGISQCACNDVFTQLDTCAKGQEGYDLCLKSHMDVLPVATVPSFYIPKTGTYAEPFDLVASLCYILSSEHLNYPSNCPSGSIANNG